MVCVKPKDITKVLKEVSPRVNKNHLVLSIAAGIQIRQIEKVNFILLYSSTQTLIKYCFKVSTR